MSSRRICSVILLGTEVRLTGSAIDLQRSSSSSAWLCRVFWFLCAPPHLDTFVQADASPGYCWPFQGSRSEVLIRLPAPVQPMAITIQHASKTASPLGTVSSAPRDFTVSGLDEEGEDETLLGTFTYAMQQEPTQTFPLQNGIPRAFQFLKLGIQSNWGKPGYTCIRRVQVRTLSQDDQDTSWKGPARCSCRAGETERLVFSVAYSLAVVVLSLQRCLSTGISILKDIIALKKDRLVPLLVLMSLAALGSAIDLQRSSSSSAWLCRVFWFLCAPPHLDTFVQADASPGYCWPFQGSRSEVLIRLPAPVQPMAITIQHASKTASPLGTVSSAPRDFTVSGLDEEGEDETLLGTFTYAMQQEPTQTFPLQNGIPRAFQFLKLGIQSNWGKPGYTCIRRVQVRTLSQDDQDTSWKGPARCSCRAGETERLVFSVAYSLAVVVLSLQRCLSTGISILKDIIALKKDRLVPLLVLMSLAALGSAIDLQRSSSSSAWLCRVFWFLCAPPHLDTFVQADASPGYCWPFQGSRSEVLIRLPAPVQPMAITIQHASKTASPLGTVSSAPRDFTVSGLDEEGEDETLLGTFTYAMQQEPTQTFPLQNGIPRAFQFLKLGIQSNWGKPGYTCIRRVQVYGKIAGTNAISQTHVQTSPN
ncbi:sperm-associated antigen 4 protein-like [Grus japonensis]|uniref:Sperm-associated antigen 4 protein-like n=1 Tax=Grus japonensis TaxID=30415 RepID=A0ABC9Y2M2_GRUJA